MSGNVDQRATFDPIEDAAREWAVLLNSGDVDHHDRLTFERWIDESSAHRLAYERYERLLADLSSVDTLDQVAIEGSRNLNGKLAFASSLAAAAAIVLIFAFFSTGLGSSSVGDSLIETQIAEIRKINLPDGSRVTLGARSRIEIEFSSELRLVRLLDGEAFFDVELDADRPFYVAASDRFIRVVGTEFAVRSGEDIFKVTVAEGVVEVIEAATPVAAERKRTTVDQDALFAGDQVVLASETEGLIRSAVEPEEAGAWRRGWLSYDNASLAEIVADVSRYDARIIRFASPELSKVRVTAAFGAEDLDQFILALTASHDISADFSDSDLIVLRDSGVLPDGGFD